MILLGQPAHEFHPSDEGRRKKNADQALPEPHASPSFSGPPPFGSTSPPAFRPGTYFGPIAPETAPQTYPKTNPQTNPRNAPNNSPKNGQESATKRGTRAQTPSGSFVNNFKNFAAPVTAGSRIQIWRVLGVTSGPLLALFLGLVCVEVLARCLVFSLSKKSK